MEIYQIRYVMLIVIVVLVGMSAANAITGMFTQEVTLEPVIGENRVKQSNSAVCSSAGPNCQWDILEQKCACP